MMSQIYVIRFFAIIWCTFSAIYVLRCIRRNNRSIYCLAFLLFYIFFVLPLFVHTIYPFEYYSFIEANAALKDVFSNSMYALFVIGLSIFLTWNIRKVERKRKRHQFVEADIFVPKPLTKFCFAFILFTLALILIKNGPGILFAGYGARLSNPSYNVFEPLITVSMLFYLIVLNYSKGDKKSKALLLMKVISTLVLLVLVYIHGKRFIVAQFAMLFVYSLFMAKKINGKQLIALCGVCFVAVVGFAYIYGVVYKHNAGSLVEYMLIDLSRHYTLMYQFYCGKIGRAISVHQFDAIIADITAILPRSIWPDKPYPFSNSITRSLVGLIVPQNENIGWSTTITFFSDLFDSFSYFGIFIGLIILYLIFKKIDATKKPAFKVFGLYLTINLFTVQFSSFIIPLLIFLVIVLVANKMTKKRVRLVKRTVALTGDNYATCKR